MYFFYLDYTVLQQLQPSYTDPNTYITMGTTASVEAKDPSVNRKGCLVIVYNVNKGVNGLTFSNANNDQMFVTLSTELQNYNFVSFWVYVADSTPSSSQHTIMSIVTVETYSHSLLTTSIA